MVVVLAVVSSGCGRSHVVDERPQDAGAAPPDAAGRDGRGPADGPLTSPGLVNGLACRMTSDHMLDAIMIRTACEDDASVVGLYELWRAGLYGIAGASATGLSPHRTYACSTWRCLAAATDCSEHARCLEATEVDCVAGHERCTETGLLQRCSGEHWVDYLDCPSFGRGFECVLGVDEPSFLCGDPARCGACVRGTCSFRPDLNELGCRGLGSVSLCDGEYEEPCERRDAGASCQWFAISGEVPIAMCAPPGFGGAGGYDQPAACEGGVITFGALYGTEPEIVRYDCVEEGFTGCNDRGCTL